MNWNTPGAEAFPPKVLNFYRLVFFVVHILPQVMQEVWKKLMDLSLTFHSFDAAQAVRDVGPVKNGTVIHLERDCATLFEAILNTKVHAQPSKSGELSSLYELYVKPPSGKFHDSIQSPTGNKAETVALVVDQLRLLRNAIFREANTEMIDEDKFDHLITLARDTFNALDLDGSLIDKFVKLSEEDFPTEKCKQLQERLKAESYYAGQIKDLSDNLIEVKSEDQSETCTPNFQCMCDEQHDESLLSVGATASLNSLPASPSDAKAKLDYPPKWSPSASTELKENAYHTRTSFDSSAKQLADHEGMSRNEEGLKKKEDHNDTENVSVDDGIEKSDQEGQQSEQCNGTCPCCQRNSAVISQCYDRVSASNSIIIQLQDDITAYQDRCRKQEDEISQLKEKLIKTEEEKQGLEAEVGRQLFLESKEKRRTEKIFQWLDEHAHEQSMLVKARGASYEGELLHGAGSIDRSEQLITSSDENGEFFGRDTFSCLEANLGDEGPVRSFNEADETFDELEEFGESSETSNNPSDRYDSHFGDAVQTTVTHDRFYLQASGGGEMSSFDSVCPEDNLYNESPSSVSTSSLNSFQVGQSSLGAMLEFIQHSSPTVAEAAFNQLTQGEYVSIETLSNSFSKPQTGSEELSSEDEIKRSGEDFPDRHSGSCVKNQANEWEHLGARPRDVPPKKNSSSESSSSFDLTPQQDAGPVALGVHNPLLPEHTEDKQTGPECCEWLSTDEVGLLSRSPDTETRETMKYIPRHTEIAFLLDHIRELREELARLTVTVKLQEEKILALQVQRHWENISRLFTEDVREQSGPGTAREASSDLYHKACLVDSLGLFRRQRLQEISNSLSESEFHRLKGLVQPKLDSFRLAKIREGSELFQELESRGEFSCTYVRDLLQGINRSDLAEKLFSSHNSDELSERDSDSLQERDQLEDGLVTYSDTENRNSDEMEKTSGMTAGIEGDEEVSLPVMHSSETSLNSDDEGAVVTITSENPNDSSSIVSLQVENINGVNQDSLPCGNTSTPQHNLSGARNIDQIDTVLNQSNSFVSCRSNEWEYLGARPRGRPPKADSSAEVSSLDSSLVDLVPHQGPGVSGVANAFLARHAEAKCLCESYNNADRAKLYFGDFQVALRPDPLYYRPNSGNSTFQLVGSTDNSLLELEQRVEEACAMVERVLWEREERKKFERKEHERQEERLQKRREREACPEALQTPSLHQEERSIGITTTCIVESLDATHYSPQALAQGIRDARMRISARDPQFRRWWCTCPVEHDQATSLAICTTCFKYRHLGPCKVRVQSGHDECCICQVDTSCGLHLLPCSHKGHLLCIVRLILHNILHCPSCLRALFPPC